MFFSEFALLNGAVVFVDFVLPWLPCPLSKYHGINVYPREMSE